MIIYCTETIKEYSDWVEKELLNEMGVAGWILACVSTINNGVGAKYYFYKKIEDY